MIALLALFRANFNYVDDLGRVSWGYQFHFNRYMSDFFSAIIHDGTYLADLSPFTQILAAVFLSVASTLAIYLLTRSKAKPKFNFWFVVAALPIGLSPYFAENLSYKFDTPYMALSVLCGILPFVFYKVKNKNYAFIIASFLCTLIICTTYQASTGVFPTTVLLMALLMFNQKQPRKEILKFILISTASYLAGILIFKFFIMTSVDDYVSTNILSLGNLIPGTLANYRHYVATIYHDFRFRWLLVMALIMLTFIITNVFRSKQKKLIASIASVIVLFGALALSFGVYPLLQVPLFDPRAMYGFFTNLALLAIVAVDYRYAYLAKLCATYLAYAFIIFLIAYGNALSMQKQYTERRIELVNNDLNEISAGEEHPIKVDVDGSIGFAQTVWHMSGKYPILTRIVPVLFCDDEDWYWGTIYMYNYYGLNGIESNFGGDEFDKSTMKLVRQTRTHDIYQKGENVLVELK